MANNISVKDSAGAVQVVKTTDTAGVHTPHHNIDNFPATQPVSAASLPLPTGAATEATLATRLTESDFDTKTGALTETAPATDTASSGLNGRLQRIAQRLTTLLSGGLPAALGAGGGLKVDGSGTALPVSAASLPLPTGAATETTLGTRLAEATFTGRVGEVQASPTANTVLARLKDLLTLIVLAAGSNLIGRVNPEPQTANGLTIGPGTGRSLISAATTNATSVKASAGQVYALYAHNLNAAVRYLKLYNKASAPTVGTDVPVLTLPIPGNTAGAGFVLDTGGMGIAFATGIALALTTGVADADTGAVAANEIVVTVLFK